MVSGFEVPVPGGSRPAVRDPRNRRMKLYGLTAEEFTASPEARSLLEAGEEGITKVVVYAPAGEAEAFSRLGFTPEARIVGYFADDGDAELCSFFLDPDRAADRDAEEHDRVVALARSKRPRARELPPAYTGRVAEEDDAAAVAALLARTFPDYPTPISEEVVRGGIARGSHRFRVILGPDGDLAACASAEIDHPRRNAELTDCATRPAHRGRGLMTGILAGLARDLAAHLGIRHLYTIARAGEPGMNCAFARLGYTYTGRLVNNCRMPDGWESMNVWCRTTESAPSAP